MSINRHRGCSGQSSTSRKISTTVASSRHCQHSISPSFSQSLAYILYLLCVVTFLSLPSIALAQSVTERQCHWLDGSPTTEVVACNGETTSACCKVGDVCMKTGYCFSPISGHAYRGGCTDPKWTDATVCPIGCQFDKGTAVDMYACPANQYGEIKFWCGDVSKNRTCYADNKKPNSFSFFQWTQGPIDGIAGEASASASATPSAGFPVHTAPPEQQNEASGMVSKTTPVGVGLGIGIPLLVIAACLGLLYYRERKARIGAEMLAAQHARRYDSKPPGYVFHTAPSELHDIHRGHASELPGKSIGELRS